MIKWFKYLKQYLNTYCIYDFICYSARCWQLLGDMEDKRVEYCIRQCTRHSGSARNCEGPPGQICSDPYFCLYIQCSLNIKLDGAWQASIIICTWGGTVIVNTWAGSQILPLPNAVAPAVRLAILWCNRFVRRHLSWIQYTAGYNTARFEPIYFII